MTPTWSEDKRTRAARDALASGTPPGPDELAALVDWDPEAVWGLRPPA